MLTSWLREIMLLFVVVGPSVHLQNFLCCCWFCMQVSKISSSLKYFLRFSLNVGHNYTCTVFIYRVSRVHRISQSWTVKSFKEEKAESV